MLIQQGPTDNLLTAIDGDTAELIISLQREDVEAMLAASTGKGKSKEGVFSDAEASMRLYLEDVRMIEQQLADRRMGRSIAQAIGADAPLVQSVRIEERQAQRDREMALLLGGSRMEPMPPWSANDEIGGEDQQSIDEMVARFGQLNNLARLEPNKTTAGPSSSRRVENKRAPADVSACVACNEEQRKVDLAEAPCSHVYCQDCFQQLLEAAMVDESLFPPRCCRQQFPTSMISAFVPKALMERLNQRRIELSTPNRTYCAEPSCSTFIPSESVQDERACCPRCSTKTCTTCKQLAHEGDCPNDESLRSLLQVAEEAGWQRCNQCKRMVELDVGCNHIR
ncbi:MAG: hypothetical protein M1815_002718 [Lichina confinis]|nr:MAG: hypothetical protein M1815_002718 [Lichina confinis]